METDIRRLESLLSHTNAELNRADAKFRNVGTINSLMIGAFVAIILYALKYDSHTNMIITISIASFFMALNVLSIVFAIYGVWPRKKYAHSAYDLRYIAKGKLIKEEGFIEKFTPAKIKQMIKINAISIKKKRMFIKMSMFLTVFPFSIIISFIIWLQDRRTRQMMIDKKQVAIEKKKETKK